MATIKTVANLWKLEKQNKHARDVAKRAGLLYDKFVGFWKVWMRSARHLAKHPPLIKLRLKDCLTGSGHLVGQVEKLSRKMGIRDPEGTPSSSFSPKSSEKNEANDRRIYSRKARTNP